MHAPASTQRRCFFACLLLRAAGIAALSFAGLGLVTERSVDAASCGHYVKRLGPGFVPGKTVVANPMPISAVSAEAPCPCHGPECRHSPQLPMPLSPSTPVRITATQDLVDIADHSRVHSRSCGSLFSDFSGRPLCGYPSGVYRPPSL